MTVDPRLPAAGPPTPGALACAGVFAIAAATLMYEVLLTRIFSVTMWYHFAFLAVAAALLGMTAGAVLVQVRPRVYTTEAAPRLLAAHALRFALGVPATFLLHLAIPVTPTLTPTGVLSVLATYVVVAIPFVWSGVCVCLALTRLRGSVGTVYAADLAGAAFGCLATVGALKVANAPTAVLLVAALGAAAAALFAAAAGARRLLAGALAAGALGLVVVGAAPSWVRVSWVKGGTEPGPTLHERWNSYSRIRIWGDPDAGSPPFGWGLSPVYPADRRVRQLMLSIDAVADTVLTRLDGDPAALDHLRYDVTSFAHYLRRDARVLVVGAGGGRDVLAALAFGQKSVLAIEVNEAILDAVNGRFGAYTGYLDRHPAVRFVNDEARSYITRLDGRFDLIQVSFIDTFAASAAGAYVLTEHSLYTVEAWRTFLDRLTPDGVLTFSRWYFHRFPAEIHRLVTLATTSLLEAGIREPRAHILLVRTRTGADPRYREGIGVGTLLVARRPFSPADLVATRAAAGRLGFEIALDPETAADPILEALAARDSLARAIVASPLDISPPTDDRPFFFHTVPLGRALRLAAVDQGNVSFNAAAVLVLVGALGIAGAIAGAALAGTFAIRRWQRGAEAVRASDAVFFAAIGVGYILVEISQLHRLTIFLGHPTHGLVVVLFALLLSSGAGSFAARREPEGGPLARARVFLLVPVVLLAFGLLTPAVVTRLRGLETPLRVLAAIALLTPIGLVMGAPFPRGLQLVSRRAAPAAPWLWAINGAMSVLGSLLAIVIAISVGVSAAFWTGVAAYVLAAAAGLRLARASGEPRTTGCDGYRPQP